MQNGKVTEKQRDLMAKFDGPIAIMLVLGVINVLYSTFKTLWKEGLLILGQHLSATTAGQGEAYWRRKDKMREEPGGRRVGPKETVFFLSSMSADQHRGSFFGPSTPKKTHHRCEKPYCRAWGFPQEKGTKIQFA